MIVSMEEGGACTCCGCRQRWLVSVTWCMDNLEADILLCPKCVGEMLDLLEHQCVSIVKHLSS